MTGRTDGMYSLLRGPVRQSMNKHNLFNLYKARLRDNQPTLFKQKWSAKQKTRAYHGEQVNEKQWNNVFEQKLEGVAQLRPSSTRNLATPITLQTFAPLEKRLDVCVYRAMFASSARQAHSFVVNGHVKVNGIPIRHPNYTLKPGDVFSVDPEKVLEALGRKKPSLKEAYKVDKTQVIKWQKFVNQAQKNPREVYLQQKKKHDQQLARYQNLYVPEAGQASKTDGEKRLQGMQDFNLKQMKQIQNNTTRKSLLEDIYRSAKKADEVSAATFVSQFGDGALSEKAFNVYEQLAKNNTMELSDEEIVKEFDKILPRREEGKPVGEFYDDARAKKLRQLLSELNTAYLEKIRKDFSEKPLDQDQIVDIWVKSLKKHPLVPAFSEVEEKGDYYLNLPWQHGVFGRLNESQPYFTPWRPRQFIAPFAVLPKHIEVSFPTCHAVYLRDPVARPGESEVISPFDENLHERAYMYYVKRG